MVADFYWPFLGGVEQHVRTVAHELTRRGHRVTVVTTLVGDAAEVENDGDVEVVRIRTAVQQLPKLFGQQRPWAPPVPDPVAAWAIRRIVAERHPDVIHGHDWLARSAMIIGGPGVPFVSTQHYYTLTCAKKNLLRDGRPCPGPEFRACWNCARQHYGNAKGAFTLAGTWVGAKVERRRASHQISVSAATAHGNALDPGAPGSVVIPNCLPSRTVIDGTDVDLLDALPEAPLMYVGDFRGVKGVDVLLAAYVESGIVRPLVLIGKRWPESPTTLPRGVSAFENWPNSVVRAAMARARAVVVPSVWAEPFGIVAIEAMEAGAPVVASATGGLAEIIEDGVSGLLVEPSSVADLAAALRRVDIDDALCASLVSGGAAAVVRYGAERVVDEIVGVYEAAIAEQRR
jgi:glycosyltransferase involved in cell wall biosynthesis